MFDTVPETGIWDALPLAEDDAAPPGRPRPPRHGQAYWEYGGRWRGKMQSVIAIIIIELMYLLRVPGKRWLCFGTRNERLFVSD